jgi:GT2 family glycosyltransferase
MAEVSCVMLTYDFNESLAELSKTAVNSVKFSTPDIEMVIVDNASSFGSAFTRNESDIYIRNKVNVGYPAAINQGMALSHGEFVALANNDIKVTPNWWEIAKDIFKNDKVGTVHFRMVGYDETTELGQETMVTGGEKWCSSSFFVVRREAFQGYDENYGAGGYDDYSHHYRMRRKGWKQAYTNKAAYFHMDSITYRTMEDQKKRAQRDARNREYFKKTFGEYPDVLFDQEFPEQKDKPWRPMP